MDRLYEFGQLGTSKLCENCGGLFTQTKFRGIPIQSTPNDLFILQEIIHEHSPDVIIETGTASGGSAVFYATHLGPKGLVVTIDINGVTDSCVSMAITGPCKKAQDHHKWESNVRSLKGRSDDPLIHQQVGELLEAWAVLYGRKPNVMMSLDGPHLCEPVYSELIALGGYVTENQYIVVQDTKMDHQYLHIMDQEYDQEYFVSFFPFYILNGTMCVCVCVVLFVRVVLAALIILLSFPFFFSSFLLYSFHKGGNGPLCAVKKFFESASLLSKSFVVDRRRELFGSQHQQGWLLKM